MAISKTLYLFSAVEGTVLRNGQPVEGVEVEQTYHWHWKDQRGTVVVKTDANGHFRLPAVTATSWTAALLPHEPAIGQRITLRHAGTAHKGWVMTKHNYDVQGEVPGRPLHFTCALEEEAVAHPETATFGICRLR